MTITMMKIPTREKYCEAFNNMLDICSERQSSEAILQDEKDQSYSVSFTSRSYIQLV